MASITNNDQAVLDAFIEKVRNIFEIEKMSLVTLHAITGINSVSVHKVKRGEALTISLLRVMDAMGYEVAFVRTKEKKRVSDDIDAINRLITAKNKNANACRKQKYKRLGKINAGISQSELRRIERDEGESF